VVVFAVAVAVGVRYVVSESRAEQSRAEHSRAGQATLRYLMSEWIRDEARRGTPGGNLRDIPVSSTARLEVEVSSGSLSACKVTFLVPAEVPYLLLRSFRQQGTHGSSYDIPMAQRYVWMWILRVVVAVVVSLH
jgi:hypothetical protein